MFFFLACFSTKVENEASLLQCSLPAERAGPLAQSWGSSFDLKFTRSTPKQNKPDVWLGTQVPTRKALEKQAHYLQTA